MTTKAGEAFAKKGAAARRLRALLLDRFATLIEEDVNTDGFWNQCAESLGLADHFDMSPRQSKVARELTQEIADSLRVKALHLSERVG